jgi:hypothetical protein
VKTWPALLAPLALCACGARTGLDAPPLPQRPANYCQGAEATSVYVVSEQANLYSFDPPSATFTPIGALSCPGGGGPFSMAVDYQGMAYVEYQDGSLFLVNTATADCTSTPYVPSPSFSTSFGMGFSSNQDGNGETLYVAGEGSPGALGTLDTQSFTIQTVGTFSSDIGDAELTGTGLGQLYGFGILQNATFAHLADIDKTDAVILSDDSVPSGLMTAAWAFAAWGGDFYFFTSDDGVSTTVARLHPPDQSYDASYAALPGEAITGAGVSTCAPH